jgi:hypothetical protein
MALQLKHITKTFGNGDAQTEVLKNINFSVRLVLSTSFENKFSPLYKTSPLDGLSNPPKILRSVDLPDPDAPLSMMMI